MWVRVTEYELLANGISYVHSVPVLPLRTAVPHCIIRPLAYLMWLLPLLITFPPLTKAVVATQGDKSSGDGVVACNVHSNVLSPDIVCMVSVVT